MIIAFLTKEETGKITTAVQGVNCPKVGRGTVSLEVCDKQGRMITVTLNNVLYIPNASVNLISVPDMKYWTGGHLTLSKKGDYITVYD